MSDNEISEAARRANLSNAMHTILNLIVTVATAKKSETVVVGAAKHEVREIFARLAALPHLSANGGECVAWRYTTADGFTFGFKDGKPTEKERASAKAAGGTIDLAYSTPPQPVQGEAISWRFVNEYDNRLHTHEFSPSQNDYDNAAAKGWRIEFVYPPQEPQP